MVIFFIFVLFGAFMHLSDMLIAQLGSLLEQILKQTENLDLFGLIGFIFFNNLKTSFIALAFGIFLGIIPFLIIAFNGFLVGYVARLSVIKSPLGIFSLWKMLPYCFLELFAVFVSVGLGFKLGMTIFSKNMELDLRKKILASLKTFIFIVLPFLFVAAVIEGLLIVFLK